MSARLTNHLLASLLAIAITSCAGHISDIDIDTDSGESLPAVSDEPDTLILPKRPTMSQPTTSYTNEGQQRILRLINVLSGHEITGRAPSDLARETDCTASTITRDLANLKEAGFAEVVPETGCWRLSPQLVQIAIRHMAALDRAAQRLEEVRSRFSRSTA